MRCAFFFNQFFSRGTGKGDSRKWCTESYDGTAKLYAMTSKSKIRLEWRQRLTRIPLGIVGHLVLTLHKVKRKQEEIVLTGKYGFFERWSDLLSWFLSLLAITLLQWLLLGAHLGHLDALSTKFAATMSVNSALLVLDWVALLRTTVVARKVVATMNVQRKPTAQDRIVVPTSIVVSQISSVVMEFVNIIVLIGTR